MSQFKKKLRAVWDHACDSENYRYVPMATGLRGGNWRVFDTQETRFLDDSEVKNLPLETLAHARREVLM